MSTNIDIEPHAIERASFIAMVAFMWSIFYFGLSTPFITVLFGYLIIRALGKRLSTSLALVVFTILAVILFYLFIHFIGEAIRALPETAERAIPVIVDFANKKGIEVPFNDALTLKSFLVEGVRSQISYLAKFAQLFTKEFVYIIISLVITAGLFLQPQFDLDRSPQESDQNTYRTFTSALGARFGSFFQSFHTVMGAQVLISLINTFFTGLFLIVLHFLGMPLPYSFVIVVVTFLCGLLPIIGNLISNTVIFLIGVSQSISIGIIALSYLIVLHKFEYFLNSKIIGGKIKNPMWLTLLGLLVGERLGGVPGMILAPVVLHYCKIEAKKIPIAPNL
jgi:predicted PurR-regulated permease PerM